MKTARIRLIPTTLLAALAVALILTASPVLAGEKGNPNPGVLPINSTAFGQTYGEWGAGWMQWSLLSPAAVNPVLDTTGQYAYQDQPGGKVFFLAGTFGGPSVERSVTVSSDKALFFPIANWGLTYPEDVPSEVAPADAEAWMRAMLDSYLSTINPADLICEVDGVALTDLQTYRAVSPAFGFYLPEDSLQVGPNAYFSSLQGTPYQPGWHDLNVMDGYWVMLHPLTLGTHTIHIQQDGYVEVIYHLTVQ